MTAAAIYLAVLLDRGLGETKYCHPLVGFGHLARLLEARLLNDKDAPQRQKIKGCIAWLLMVVPFVGLLAYIIQAAGRDNIIAWLVNVGILYLTIGARSLAEHVSSVQAALAHGDIKKARKALANIVSRDTKALDETAIRKASIESALENGSDAIFAPLLCFIVAGAPGALCYRLLNTLDAMWGYRNDRYLHFGWCAARLDDLFNWLPARLTAFSYALMGNFQQAMHCWRTQAGAWESPNAGPVMASGAGALDLQLGGTASYHGKQTARPVLGCGRAPGLHDIDQSLALIQRSLIAWLVLIAIMILPGQLY